MNSSVVLQPFDEFNRQLQSMVHPPQWQNPTPSGRYNLVVIGAGTAGLVTAAGAAGLGAKVALIERSLMGGDCLNTGCVPSKALLSTARLASRIKHSADYGVAVAGSATVDFSEVMQRMRRLRATISPNDSAQRFKDLGVDVFFGDCQFVDSNTVRVTGENSQQSQQLSFKRAVIATGARAAVPPVPGLEDIDYLTSETLFSLQQLPARLGIIGAGPIGCEMAQAFSGFGSQVFLVEAASGILPREDPDAAQIVRSVLQKDGVQILSGGRQLKIVQQPGIRLTVESAGQHYDQAVDRVLVSAGRRPNVEGLNLQAVGVQANEKGIVVNDQLQTTNPMIYAAGDVCSRWQFTHAADFMARIVIQNALFLGRAKVSNLLIPWCTYTSPEVAHVGLSETEARQKSIAVDTYVQQLTDVDRAILDGEDIGFVKVHCKKGTDRILGATIVASHAGDLISEVTLAMKNGIGLRQIASTIHPYPTQADSIRRIGDQFSRTRLTPLVKKLFRQWLKWTR